MDQESTRQTSAVEDLMAAAEGRPIFVLALSKALGRAPIWMTTWLIITALGLIPAVMTYDFVSDATAHRYEPGALVHSMDRTLLVDEALAADATVDYSFRQDKQDELALLNASIANVGAILVLFYFLLSAFFAGGWLQVILERKRGTPSRRFLVGGSRYFWRFFRLLILSLLLMGVFSWVIFRDPWEALVLGEWLGVPPSDYGAKETLDSESLVGNLAWVQAGLWLLFVGLLTAWADYTRTRMALHDTSSALWNGLLTFFTMLRHPVKTLRPLMALFLIEAVVITLGAIGLSALTSGLFDDPTLLQVLLLGVVAQVVMLWRHITRGARYFATAAASCEVVRPLMRPDPWKESIGGPGGPRYPLEDADDEYAISL